MVILFEGRLFTLISRFRMLKVWSGLKPEGYNCKHNYLIILHITEVQIWC